ncbi:MAG: DUF5946 family protein [Gemmatimonadaceae bacterium]
MSPMDATMERCVGCGAEVPRSNGPTHRYMLSAPGCWALYGEVLARVLADPTAEGLRRRCADAFAVQHPGIPGPQAIQSVAGHLMSLYAQYELGQSPVRAHEAIAIVVRQEHLLRWLTPPTFEGHVVVRDVAARLDTLNEAVDTWARSAWQAWLPWHEQIRDWYRTIQSLRARSRT